MEFTPKKQPLSAVSASAVRHNPYASGGGNFIRKYKHRNSLSSPRSNFVVTPPRSNVQRKIISRSDRILSSSKTRSVAGKSALKKTPSKQNSLPQGSKRPFRAINGVDTSSNDPYHIWSDSDNEIQQSQSPRKESKIATLKDKENLVCSSEEEIFPSTKNHNKNQATSLFNNLKENGLCSSEDEIFVSSNKHKKPVTSLFNKPKPSTFRVYPSKRKSVDVAKSRLVSDISPDKVAKAYGSKSHLVSEEKENVPTKSVADSSTSQGLLPHLIGFPNYGNTCYLNSVLQSLLGLPTFLCDYWKIASELGLNQTSLFYGLSQVLHSRMKGQASGVKLSLRTVKENLERIDGSFSGFKMQDANEFLTKVLDTIKDEIDRCCASQSIPGSSILEYRSVICNGKEDVDEDILLCGTTVKCSPKKVNCFAENDCALDADITDNEIVNCVSEFDNLEAKSNSKTVVNGSSGKVVHLQSSGSSDKKLCNVKDPNPKRMKHVEKQPEQVLRNPVKDNFEFQLLESYRCLGCGEVEGRKQEYFGLYVNLPDDDGEHTIQDAISTYMGVDERELNCEKCGHNTSSVVTTITSLPRILIIQLKRYEYKPEQCESIKMSSKVHVNRWINLDGYMTDDVAGPSQWNPQCGNFQNSQKAKETTLTVRNLSSELNMCEPKGEEEVPSLSPAKPESDVNSTVPDNEDEELQMVMRRSMDDVQGGQEEDEIQQAIRLSLLEMGMSYSQENEGESSSEQEDGKVQESIAVEENKESGHHAYCLISIISHFGLTTNTGHYVSDVYNCEEDSWFHYDDESVAKISESVVFAEGRQKNGYIFFYMHKDLFQKIKDKNKR